MSARKVKKILVLSKTDIEEARLIAAIQSFAEAELRRDCAHQRSGKGMDE